MTIPEFIAQQQTERQALLTDLHQAIVANDANVSPVIASMMGKEMILYNQRGFMKYGLASVTKYLSLHCMPMYMNPPLHAKYLALLPKAKFQKGCINFTDAVAMPVDIAAGLIKDASAIDIAAMLENRHQKKR